MRKKTELIVQTLKQLAEENGGLLLPEQVVDAARPVSSPLHSKFEWSDSKAAQEYRLWQARQLLRVCVELIPQSKTATDVFVSLKSDRREGGYRQLVEVLSSKQMRAQLLSDALDELNWFREKYSHLRELAQVFSAIRKVRRK